VQLGGVWPIGDSPPLLVTALTADSSARYVVTSSTPAARPAPGEGVSVDLYTDVDMRLLVGDLLAKLRLHEQRRP
jgi:purine nucleosidase